MRKYYFILLIAAVSATTSCKKWLDISPESDISADDLFKTQEGFQEALNGVYTRCIKQEIYGNELTIGLPEVLAQNYSMSSFYGPSDYREVAKYNYKHNDFMGKRDNIWKGLYSAIVNANLILQNIEGKQALFSGNNYAVIKGEALALRAYLHFDVFRLFGSSYQPGTEMTGIPYVTTYTNKTTAMSSADEALNLIIKDLTEAKQILANTDSITNKAYKVGYAFSTTDAPNYKAEAGTEMEGNSLFTQNRRHRLNYYAVCGELARVYLYKNDKSNALTNALEVIQSNKFPWTTQSFFLSTDVKKKDRILYKELVFGWFLPNAEEYMAGRFQNGTSGFFMETASADRVYEKNGVGGSDLRYKQWFQFGNTASETELVKYKRNLDAKEDDLYANLHPQMAPGIRLSEMYYIASEASYDTDPVAALDYLNKVRFQRGMGTPLVVNSKDEFINELIKEARKEWYGEGQLFYMYKRLNKAIVGLNGAATAPSKAVFVLPLPNDEIEFGGR